MGVFLQNSQLTSKGGSVAEVNSFASPCWLYSLSLSFPLNELVLAMKPVVSAFVKQTQLDGYEMFDQTAIGKEYKVNPMSLCELEWSREEVGFIRKVLCVYDVVNEGFIPVELLSIPEIEC